MCRTGAVPFSQNSRLEDQLVPHGEVSNLQVLEQLVHNVAHVLVVAHGEEQVQAATPDADVWILQCGYNAFLMPEESRNALNVSSVCEAAGAVVKLA